MNKKKDSSQEERDGKNRGEGKKVKKVPEKGDGIIYWLVTLVFIPISGGLITLIGAYIAHRGHEVDIRFWDVLRWKPWLIITGIFQGLTFVFYPLAFLIPNFVGYYLIRKRYKNEVVEGENGEGQRKDQKGN